MQSEVKRKSASAQTFFRTPQAIDLSAVAGVQNAWVLDWTAVRAEVRRLRAENNLTRQELQALSGVEKTTIYRVENTKELPDYKPDFDTIVRLLTAMEVTVSKFFARIEGLTPTAEVATVSPSPATLGGGDRSSIPRTLDDTTAIIAANSAALVALARSLDRLTETLAGAREQTPSPRTHKPSRSVQTRRTG